MVIRYFLSFFFFLLVSLGELFAQSQVDSILNVLDGEIEHRKEYALQKEDVVVALKQQLKEISEPREEFLLNDRIYDEYKSYQYDSAYVYAMNTIRYADMLNDKDLKVKAQSNLVFCFLSAGLFKEAVDIADATNVGSASAKQKAHFYSLCARLYSDLLNYNDLEWYKQNYEKRSVQYCDSALLYLEPSSYEYHDVLLLRNRGTDTERKIDDYKRLIEGFHNDNHQLAINASNLANLFLGKKDTVQAVYYLAVSAIADIKSATMETTSKTVLAECLYNKGDIQTASKYIHVALEEANFYNARHRILSINSILPIIEKAHLNIIEKQRDDLKIYLIGASTLLVLFLVASSMVYLQNRKLKAAKRSVQEHVKELFSMNEKLNQTNEKLKESNEIKDVYITQSLYAKSDYLDKTEELLKKLDYRLKARQYNDLHKLNGEFNLKEERKNLFLTFDRAFLMLFPNFVDEYNKLFPPEERVCLDNNGALPPELRIFALIRLGITENEKIARFLNLSMNTIYSYKAKTKNKTLVPKEEFEARIMKIKKNPEHHC